MRRKKLWSLIACGLSSFASVRVASADALGYTLDVTTHYQFGAPGGSLGYGGSPDTGFIELTNSGTTTFTGLLGDVALSNFSGDFSQSVPITLNPGDTAILGTSPESSNIGGFNDPYNNGTPQRGIIINIVGTVSDGVNTEGINLSVNDSNIHSGVPRTNPYGVTLDNYVLQGGDPFGRDTGDGYETTQADGHFRFLEEAQAAAPTPAAALSGLAMLGGLAVVRSVRRKTAVAN
jgi:hypothetical protein